MENYELFWQSQRNGKEHYTKRFVKRITCTVNIYFKMPFFHRLHVKFKMG